jgi:hypothetical protein
MTAFRRYYYLLLGFSFPIFWMLHCEGLMSGLYRPIQRLFSTERCGWPSFISAFLLYLIITAIFEVFVRVRPKSE